jgi:hypothetical protein
MLSGHQWRLCVVEAVWLTLFNSLVTISTTDVCSCIHYERPKEEKSFNTINLLKRTFRFKQNKTKQNKQMAKGKLKDRLQRK